MPASGIASALKGQLSNVMISSALIQINALVVEPVMPQKSISARFGLLLRCNSLYRERRGKLA